jgi:ubiquinone/menaquinone biosynthesis C-methylase UbiE
MKAVLVAGAGFAFAAVAVLILLHRRNHRPQPCPWWLSVLLENPYMNAVAGSSRLLDRARLTSGMRVLDVGCGPGRIAIPAAERVGPEGEVVALDVQPQMLKELGKRSAASGLTNIRTVLGDVGEAELGEDSFDCALLVTVLGEIPDPAAALRGICAALKPGGILSVTEVIPDPDYQRLGRVKRLCEGAGFRHERTFDAALAFTMNFRKPP